MSLLIKRIWTLENTMIKTSLTNMKITNLQLISWINLYEKNKFNPSWLVFKNWYILTNNARDPLPTTRSNNIKNVWDFMALQYIVIKKYIFHNANLKGQLVQIFFTRTIWKDKSTYSWDSCDMQPCSVLGF